MVDLQQAPQDLDGHAALRKELRKLLAEDACFRAEVEQLLVAAQAEVVQTSYQATMTGGGAVAQGHGATALGAGAVKVGRDVGGDVVTGTRTTAFDQRGQVVGQQTNIGGDVMAEKGITITGDGNVIGSNNQVQVRKGGIHARRIEAENVVSGVMAPAQALEQAEGLVALAHAIERGGIDADEIKARNVVDGLLITELRSVEDLRQEVTALRQQVQAALEEGEVADPGDAADVTEALSTAEAALAEPEPQGRRVARKLKEAADVLTDAAEAATAAGKTGQAVIRLAPVAMTLWKLAERLF